MSYGTSSSGDDLNRAAGSGVGAQVGEVKSQATEALGQVSDQAKQTTSTKVGEQKDRAAEGVSSVAQAFTQVGEQMREENPSIAGLADTAAERLEQFAGQLSSKDVSDLMDDVEQFARRQPAVFLGATFALGVVGARFIKSSRPASSRSSQPGYNRSPGYAYGRYDSGSYAGYEGPTGYGTDSRTGYGSTGYTTGYDRAGVGGLGPDDATTGLGVDTGSGTPYSPARDSYGTETATGSQQTGSSARETYSPYGSETRTEGRSTGSGTSSSGVGSVTDAGE